MTIIAMFDRFESKSIDEFNLNLLMQRNSITLILIFYMIITKVWIILIKIFCDNKG